LEALAQVEYGDTTWDPKYSPRHQRRISRWVRANEAMIIERLKAAGGRDTSVPTEAAVRFLAAAAMLRRRAKLPEKSHEVLREILLGPWKDEDKPVALSQKFQEVIDDMQRTYQQVRTFLLGEINVPQGLTGGINFIDPRPILRHAEAFGDDLKVGPISEEYFGSYWKSRFAPMQRINAFANLPDVLKFERESLASLLNEIRQLLEIDEGQSFDLANRIREYCIAVGAVKAAMRDTKTAARPDLVFDPLWLRKSYTESADTWGRAVQRCKEIVDTGSPLEILLFDPGKLKEAEHHLRAACNYVRNLNEDLDESESDWFKDQGQADTEAELMTLLTIIARADGTTVSDPSEIGASADSQNSDTEVSDDDGTDAE
jgi:hypothetical protein